MTIDRRKEMRIPLSLPVGCRGLGEETSDFPKFDLNCHDLSSRGMALECERPMGMDETCCFSLPLFHSQEPLTVKGKVRWRKRVRDGSKIGVRFEEPIDLSLPFPLVKDAAARVQKDAEYYRASVRNVLSDACIWVNPAGEILQYDQRVLTLLNCTDLGLKDKRVVDFIHPGDQEGIEWFFKKLKKPGNALPAKRVLRLRSDGNMGTFCQFSVPAKPPWSGAAEVYLKDVTQSHRLEEQNRQLEQIVRTFCDCINGKMVILDPDLTITEARGRILGQRDPGENGRFKGMLFRKATGLAGVKMNGKTLWRQLKSCVETGRPMTSRPITYLGRVDQEDLLEPGDFRVTLNPSRDSNNKVSLLVMLIEAMSSFGADLGTSGFAADASRLESILEFSATGLVLREAVKEVYDPLTHLLAQLDLFSHKMDIADKQSRSTYSLAMNDPYVADRARVQGLVGELCDRLKSIQKNVISKQGPGEADPTNINVCLAQAIDAVRSSQGTKEDAISTTFAGNLPAVNVDAHELIMMFIIFLLTSKSCLAHVSDKTIRCETKKERDHVVAKISHNSCMQKQDDLKIIFGGKPLQSYFFQTGSVQSTETLLHYANFLSNKHNIKIRLTNIPGHFELCFAVPKKSGAKRS